MINNANPTCEVVRSEGDGEGSQELGMRVEKKAKKVRIKSIRRKLMVLIRLTIPHR